MKICVVGTGYVGLVSGACFAEIGNSVICADADAKKIAALQRGECPIFEPGLPEMIERNVHVGRLKFTTEVGAAIAAAQVVVIAVGTPPKEDGSADLSAVESVARQIAAHATGPTVLVLKSTVPVGTNERIREIVKGAAAKIAVVNNPEFLKQGNAVTDFMRPDRIIVGVREEDVEAREAMRSVYQPLSIERDHMMWMDPASAELTKYVANAMLAARISFMNEIARLCERVGADVHAVRVGVGSDARIGSKFLYAGPGYGGSCFPKDVSALVQTAKSHGVDLEMALATERVNSNQRHVLHHKVKSLLGGALSGARVAVWGLAFKPNTDDTRESPALDLLEGLLADGATVIGHDPQAMNAVRERFGARVHLVDDFYAAAEGADAVVLVTEWHEYRNPDFTRLKAILRKPVLLDGRNIWTRYKPWTLGFTYEGIGVHNGRGR
jgi:UDPglucose 6-dehydrogenase